MDRDDLLLRAIADGATTSAEVADRTGITPSSVWRGLRHLVGTGHVFSPARGVYRVTALGARVLALPDREPSTTSERPRDRVDRGSLVDSSVSAPEPGPATRQAPPTAETEPDPERTEPEGSARAEGRSTVRAWLVGSALVALGVGVIALLSGVARPAAPAPPAAAPPLSGGWPYNGWQGWGQ